MNQTITVKETRSAYTTCTVQGKRASSTMSAETAVQRLGEKLLGADLACVQQVIDTTLPTSTTHWHIIKKG